MVAGAIAPAGGGRTIFVLPWLGQTLIGTTDNDYEGELEHIKPADGDIAYLLDAVNAFFGSALEPGDIAGAYAGVRPLISTGDPKKSVDISRKAELYETSSGMVTITGGKLTTWRRMAKMTVDRIVEREGRDAPCRTHQVPLGMAVAPGDLPRVARRRARGLRAARRPLRLRARTRCCGSPPSAPSWPRRCRRAASTCWPRPSTPRGASRRGPSATCCCAARGSALTAGRALCAEGSEAPARVAAAMGAELGWDEDRRAAEVAAFRGETAAEGSSSVLTVLPP